MLGFILELRKFFGSCRRSLPAARNMKNLLVILQAMCQSETESERGSESERESVSWFSSEVMAAMLGVEVGLRCFPKKKALAVTASCHRRRRRRRDASLHYLHFTSCLSVV